MLVRTDATSRHPVDGHLAALADERVFCSEFRYPRGTEVFGEGEETEYVYQITSGEVRTYKLLVDGRRQINSFHLAGCLDLRMVQLTVSRPRQFLTLTFA
jgi:CRP/FNR family transcriptional regulator, nitrogen fixation regulation protein